MALLHKKKLHKCLQSHLWWVEVGDFLSVREMQTASLVSDKLGKKQEEDDLRGPKKILDFHLRQNAHGLLAHFRQ